MQIGEWTEDWSKTHSRWGGQAPLSAQCRKPTKRTGSAASSDGQRVEARVCGRYGIILANNG